MTRTFRTFWILWRLAFVAAVAVEPLIPGDWWVYMWAAFLLVEGIGIARSARGDTLSESHWAIGKRGWAFRIFSIGFAAAYSWQAARLPMLAWGIEPSVAWYFICAGLFGWLSSHFFFLGRHG